MEQTKRFSFFDTGDLPQPQVKAKPQPVTPVAPRETRSAKYRCEQTVVTKVNGVIANHAETKREFHIKRSFTDEGIVVDVEMTDNIINLNPPQLQEAVSLVCEIDNVKCNTRVLVDSQTGKMKRILNHEEIISNWNTYKDSLNNRYSFLRDPEARTNLQKFISGAEVFIKDEKLLIADLETKLFFDVFFDTYLTQEKPSFGSYTRTFYSQLFDALPVPVNIEQLIMNETPNAVYVSKIGKMDTSKLDLARMNNIYEQKFKPMIQYKFSEFNFSYIEKNQINTAENLLQTAEVNIVEEVKNNIQILINYNLKQIE
ncbi:hypothetical protein [Mucilaginibacter polytrichastri]|uniref:Uncharacterized protein n=1 Tax=Mucilaginibacter polytrichastri TaxID=1302689 RepID=A0A1Q6A3R3_9SPHI|nr:hypothetical protein [Mucilaginibacter polytrichastri]OKS88640.1 hypothetical protein RG47T_4112 [Mucilaginibacter polytrichastri]SFT26410.1 hypothetical protein SAMN04487890_12521 [Mucilaginibacter polytrichastri]